MKLKAIFNVAAIALLLAGSVQVAEASILGDMLNYGELNIIRDDSVGVLNDGTRSLLTPQVGDILQGIFKVNDVENVVVQNASIWGIYSLQVTSVSAVTGIVTLGVPTAGSGNRISEIMTTLGLATPTNARSGSMADATVVVVEKAAVESLPDFVGGSFDATLASVIDASWSADLVAGLVDPLTNYHEVLLIPAANQALFSLSYSVINDVFPAGIDYDDLSGLNRFTTGLPGIGQFTTRDTAIIGLTPSGDATGWQFTDKANFQIQPTPEPASVVIWAAIAGGISLVVRRRLSIA